MAHLPTAAVKDLADLERFEAELTLSERLPERSVLDVFMGTAERLPDRVALTQLVTGAPDETPRRVTFRELLGLVRRAANLFHALGGPRPVVAYMLPALIETHATLWGAETAGTAVPINFLLQPAQIAALIRTSDATILVALGPHPALDVWQKALALREQIPGLVLVRVGAPGAPVEDGVVDLGPALTAQPDDHLTFGDPRRDDDVAAYFHTGGTTGTPKLVAHTHRSQLVAALGGVVLGDLRPTDTLTATLPLFHVGGTIYCGLSAFMAGVSLVIMSPSGLRNPAMVRGFWSIVERYGATIVGAVPTSIGAVLDAPIAGADLSRVRVGFCGAASLPLAVGRRFREVVGRGLLEVYGMTEASGLIAIDPAAGEGALGSVGLPLPYTRVVVRKLEAGGRLGASCATDEIGVITVRGPHIAPGYKNPDDDPSVFDDGVLNTGDLGYTDASGRLYIAGRAKDLIIRSGHNIDPLMIENAMTSHPAVALAAAVGQPDAYAGELPVCYVALRPGASAEVEELQEHAHRTIDERPAWPKQIHVVDAIPLTMVGKIYKPALRCDAAKRVVTRLVREELQLEGAHVQVAEGGPRGMRVRVVLPAEASASVPRVTRELEPFLFEASVTLGDARALASDA
jgi:fatty-acyl-CoA synthase